MKRAGSLAGTAFGLLLAYAIHAPSTWATELLTRQLDSATDAFPDLELKGPWLKVCEALEEATRCRYEQTVSIASGAEVNLSLLAPPPGGTPVALFRAPLGVLLPAGLRLTFDGGSPGTLQFGACSRFGCSASAPLEGQFRALLARSNRLIVEFASPAEEPFKVEFSLSGSAAILKAM